jgi:ABC-type transport system involved in multi-copper enzyme maturation permease subunit
MDEAWVAKLLTNYWNSFLLIIVCIWVGSGLVARDRKERTLEVFLGRALGPRQYLWAKGAALGSYLLLFTFVPTVVLVIFHVGLSGDTPFLWQHARVLWGTLLYTVLGPGTLVLVVMALSSLSRSPRVVGLALVGAAFFGPPAAGILFLITKSPLSWTLAVLVELQALGYHCLGADPPAEISAPHAAIYFVLLAAGSLVVLWLRFKDREVLR